MCMEFAAVLEVNDPGERGGCLSDCITDLLSLCSATASPLPHWAWLSDAYTLQVNKECHQHSERIRWEASIERAVKSDRKCQRDEGKIEGHGQKPKNRIGGETKARRQRAEWDRCGTGRLNATILSTAENKVPTVSTQEKNMRMWVYTENSNGISLVFWNSLHVTCNKTEEQN